MIRNRYLILTVAIITLIALFSGCSRHRWHENRSERFLEHMDEHVEDLKLTEDQQKQYEKIRVNMEAEIAKQFAQHKEFKVILMDKLNEDNPDISAINTMLKDELKGFPPKIAVYLDYFEEFYNTLNAEQQKMVLEEIRSKANRWKR